MDIPFPLLQWLPSPRRRRLQAAKDSIRYFMEKALRECDTEMAVTGHHCDRERHDLVSRISELRTDGNAECAIDMAFTAGESTKPPSTLDMDVHHPTGYKEKVDELMPFFMAGFETTGKCYFAAFT
jgi:hypothetical protein